MYPTPDYDSPWKDLLDDFFAPFMAFFFPLVYAAIDWEQGVEFLDKELQKITADAAVGRRFVDKLVKVRLKTGAEFWVLLHIEVQGSRETGFALRIFIYNCRLFQRYKVPVASFVILTDDDPNWRPTEYRQELFGTSTVFRFEAVKFLDYEARWAELEASDNIFAVVVMAHLRMLSTRHDPAARLRWKLWLTKRLYERGYDKLTIVKLYKFLDWLMWLPEEFEQEYDDEMIRYEEEKRMPYVTSIERRGRVEGAAGVTLRQLQQLCGTLAAETQARIRKLPVEELEELGAALLKFGGLQDLQAWLAAHSPETKS